VQAQLTRQGWSPETMQALHKLLAADTHSPFDMLGSLESVQHYREPPAKGKADQAITQVYQVSHPLFLMYICIHLLLLKPEEDHNGLIYSVNSWHVLWSSLYVCSGHLWQATQHQQVELASLQKFECRYCIFSAAIL